jgi:hypothetical protein
MYYIFVQAIGFVGMLFCVSCYQIKNSRLLILCQMVGNMFFMAQYMLLGAFSGSVIVLISVVSSFLISFKGRRTWADWKGWPWLFSLLSAVACALTWRNAYDLIAMTANIAFILTGWTKNGKVIRVGKLTAVAPLWITYNLLVHSYAGIVSELIGIASTIASIWRYGLKELDKA